MKRIEATIKPFTLDPVREALKDIGVDRFSATEVKDFGNPDATELYRGTQYSIDFAPRIKIEITVPDELVESVIQTIVSGARTKMPGNGFIFVQPVEHGYTVDDGLPLNPDMSAARAGAASRATQGRRTGPEANA